MATEYNVTIRELLTRYCREEKLGEHKNFRLVDQYSKTASITFEVVNKEYLQNLINDLSANMIPDVDDRPLIAALLRDHPMLKDHVEEVMGEDLIDHPADDPYASPTYGDLQSPSAAKMLEETEARKPSRDPETDF